MAGDPNIREVSKGTRFRKGVSGNPGGRPKGTSIMALLRAELAKPCVEGSPVTRGERIADILTSLAMQGDLAAIKEVLDRTEGKAVARIEQGEAGACDDLAHLSTEELREMLRTAT